MGYKDYFDIPGDIVYLNTPGNGLMPRSHHIWRSQRDKDFFDLRSDLRDQQYAFIQTVKEAAGRLFNCPVTSCYAIPNFSFGFNTLLEGMHPKTKFAIIGQDYPSLNYPVISRGFTYTEIQAHADIEENIAQCIRKNKPDVLALSIVNYITGLKIDLDFIKQLKKDYPQLIIIGDATQYLGTEPFDFEASGFDAIGFSGYKWMMAGFGNGLLFLSERLQSILYKKAQLGPGPKEAMWADKTILDIFFEPGHIDTLSLGTLGQSLLFLQTHGLAEIQAHIKEVSDYAYQELANRNLLLPLIQQRHTRSSLINVQVSTDIYPTLLTAGLKCFPRGTGIRIGIHLYNEKADIDRLISLLGE